jgi:preprotein translocase subunit SecE
MRKVMAKSGIRKFFSFVMETRREIDKVTWPSRKEVIITTIVVFVIALVASLFFALVDTAWYRIVHSIIGA